MIKCPICQSEIKTFKTSNKGKAIIITNCLNCGYIMEFVKSSLDKYGKSKSQQDL